MLEQQTFFKGLNRRSNDINRDPSYASDLLNVELNSKAELIKRYGFDQLDNTLANALNIFENVERNELLVMTTTGLKRWNGVSWDSINYGGDTPSNYSLAVDTAEYNGITYITDPAGVNDLMKYDGLSVYKAGMKQVNITTVAAAGTYYFRVAVYAIDAFGNKVWSDYDQVDTLIAAATVTFDNPVVGEEFYNKYGYSNGAQIINAGNLTLTTYNTVPHPENTYVANDRLLFADGRELVIDSRTATSITFTAASVGAGTFNYADFDAVEADRLVYCLFRSSNSSYGYKLVEQGAMPLDLTPVTTSGAYTETEDMDNIYDTTIVKGLPPKCKYITMYNNIMVLTNREAVNATLQLSPELRDAIYWSDLGVASTVETFAPFDYEPIGKTSEGQITGLFSDVNGVIVFKERDIYYINGILTGRQFREERAQSSGIGCVSFQSIIQVEGGCLFMSNKGIFQIVNFGVPLELSDIIEPFFRETTSLDLTKAVGTLDVQNEKVYMYIPSSGDDVVVVFDYYYKEWFVHKGIDADGGIYVFNDDLYHIDGTATMKRSSSYNDNGVAIEAYWKSSWFNRTAPSLKSKFLNFIIFSLGAVNWKAIIEAEKNWVESVFMSESKDITVDNKYFLQNVDNNFANSLRFTVKNDILDEGMLVTSFEYEVSDTQQRPKL